ncbi:transposase [Streptomyces sp. 3330]|nr:transposase [Streptomyces sp. 3330]
MPRTLRILELARRGHRGTDGIGVRTSVVLLAGIGDASSFPSAAHLASYDGHEVVRNVDFR